MSYTVYIIYSKSIDKFYVGYTNNLQRRFGEHNRKKHKYTDRGIPWIVVHTETFKSKNEAMDREAFIKKQKSRKFIEELINQNN